MKGQFGVRRPRDRESGISNGPKADGAPVVAASPVPLGRAASKRVQRENAVRPSRRDPAKNTPDMPPVLDGTERLPAAARHAFSWGDVAARVMGK